MMYLEERIWFPVSGYENEYLITTDGKIKSLHKRKYQEEIVQKIDRGGYVTVTLSRNGISKTKWVHRLVALNFIPNLLNKPEVNHLNGNTKDNRMENLEWVTHRENILHAYEIGLFMNKKRRNINQLRLFD